MNIVAGWKMYTHKFFSEYIKFNSSSGHESNSLSIETRWDYPTVVFPFHWYDRLEERRALCENIQRLFRGYKGRQKALRIRQLAWEVSWDHPMTTFQHQMTTSEGHGRSWLQIWRLSLMYNSSYFCIIPKAVDPRPVGQQCRGKKCVPRAATKHKTLFICRACARRFFSFRRP